MRATPADRTGHEAGSALVVVVLVMAAIAALGGLVAVTANQASTGSARDRNSDLALSVAEAGVHHAIARIEASIGLTGTVSGTTPTGVYDVDITTDGDDYILDAVGTVGTSHLSRSRRVLVTLSPPDWTTAYGLTAQPALVSRTSIELKNNTTVDGDVWANDSLSIGANSDISGSATAAQSWMDIGSGASVGGDVVSGGYNDAEGNAIDMHGGVTVDGNVSASVSAPTDAVTCGGEPQSEYDVDTANGVVIGGNLTSWGTKNGPGVITGSFLPNTCTASPTARPVPDYDYLPGAHDPAQTYTFDTVAAFGTWLAGRGGALDGTIVVSDPAPSQTKRINLTGADIVGDLTLVTSTPVFANQLSDNAAADGTIAVIVSSYAPPSSSVCDVNHDSSECAVHLKNNLDASCKTSLLVHASEGPVAVKNTGKMCGAILSEAILVKNGQDITFAPALFGLPGLGEGGAYRIARWLEMPVGDAS